MPASQAIVDTVADTNMKTVGEAAAFAMGQGFQNAVSHAKRIDAIAEVYLGQLVNTATSVDPVEAVAAAKLFKGESDSSLGSLLTILSAGQIGAKIGQTTPPETGAGGLANLAAILELLKAK